MTAAPQLNVDSFDSGDYNDQLFERIAEDLLVKGVSIQPNALPPQLGEDLCLHLAQMQQQQFQPAGVGRGDDHTQNRFVRSDSICWINGDSPAGRDWLAWTAKLQTHLNRRLFLGLFSFESHFAHYRPGDFYKTHLDAFKGEANRVLSLVCYLNSGWQPSDEGELVLYPEHQPQLKVTPALGTLVVFLSEEFPHEVLTAGRDRYSISGWYRVNSSVASKVDPAR